MATIRTYYPIIVPAGRVVSAVCKSGDDWIAITQVQGCHAGKYAKAHIINGIPADVVLETWETLNDGKVYAVSQRSCIVGGIPRQQRNPAVHFEPVPVEEEPE